MTVVFPSHSTSLALFSWSTDFCFHIFLTFLNMCGTTVDACNHPFRPLLLLTQVLSKDYWVFKAALTSWGCWGASSDLVSNIFFVYFLSSLVHTNFWHSCLWNYRLQCLYQHSCCVTCLLSILSSPFFYLGWLLTQSVHFCPIKHSLLLSLWSSATKGAKKVLAAINSGTAAVIWPLKQVQILLLTDSPNFWLLRTVHNKVFLWKCCKWIAQLTHWHNCRFFNFFKLSLTFNFNCHARSCNTFITHFWRTLLHLKAGIWVVLYVFTLIRKDIRILCSAELLNLIFVLFWCNQHKRFTTNE